MNQDTLDGSMKMENTKEEEKSDHSLLSVRAMSVHFPVFH